MAATKPACKAGQGSARLGKAKNISFLKKGLYGGKETVKFLALFDQSAGAGTLPGERKVFGRCSEGYR